MRFDWYAATLDAAPEEYLGSALNAYGVASLRPCKPVNGYDFGQELHAGDTVLSRTYWGGVNDGLYTLATGDASPDFATFVRSSFPTHRVPRADVCIDYDKPGAWDTITTAALLIVRQRKLKTSTVGDWIGGKDGRTLYIGSRKSAAYLRIYEKGLQLKASPDWVRVELVIQPAKRADKERMATVSPAECWGATTWSRILLQALEGLDTPPLERTPEAPTDADRALHYLLKQYGHLLEDLADTVGGWSPLGVHLEALLERQRNEQDARRVVMLPRDTRQLALDFKAEPAPLAPPPLATQLPLIAA